MLIKTLLSQSFWIWKMNFPRFTFAGKDCVTWGDGGSRGCGGVRQHVFLFTSTHLHVSLPVKTLGNSSERDICWLIVEYHFFFSFFVQFQELQLERDTLLTTNRSLAEESLARRPRLCNGKLQLAEKYRALSNLATTCWEKQSQLGELRGGGLWFPTGRQWMRPKSVPVVMTSSPRRSPSVWVNMAGKWGIVKPFLRRHYLLKSRLAFLNVNFGGKKNNPKKQDHRSVAW